MAFRAAARGYRLSALSFSHMKNTEHKTPLPDYTRAVIHATVRDLCANTEKYVACAACANVFEARHGIKVSDLRPVGTLQQLKELALDGTQEPDVSPLLSCSKLEQIVLPQKVKNLDALRQLPSLKGLSWGFPGSWDKLTPVAEFWNQGISASEEALARDQLFTDLVKLMRQRIDKRVGDERHQWLKLGAAMLASGDLPEYRRVCAAMLAKYKDSTDPLKVEAAAKTCLLTADSGIDPAELAKLLAPLQVGDDSPPLPGHLGTQGLANYRSQHWAEAAELLARVKGDEAAECVAAPILAMAHYRLRSPKAKAELEHARQLVGAHWPVGPADTGIWHDWLTAHLLLEEAERLFADSADGEE